MVGLLKCFFYRKSGTILRCIVANAIACVGSDLIFALEHPEPQFPHKMFLVGGLLKYVPLPDWMMYALINAIILLFAGVLASILLMFAYRFDLIHEKQSYFLHGLCSFRIIKISHCLD